MRIAHLSNSSRSPLTPSRSRRTPLPRGACLLVLGLLLSASSASAGEPAHSSQKAEASQKSSVSKGSASCEVDVRSLKGTAPKEENVPKQLEAGEFLADLQDQLQTLPFSHYEALSHERQKVPLHERGVFQVLGAGAEQNSVAVEVECITNDGARVKIEWNGAEGASVVSSQLRLVNGKNWVVGTDHDDSASTIVSIKVECKSGEGDL